MTFGVSAGRAGGGNEAPSSHSQSGGSPMWVPVQWRGWCNHRCWRLSMLRTDSMPGQCRLPAAAAVSPLAERRWRGCGGRKLAGPFGLSTATSGAQAGDLLRGLSTLSMARRKRTLVVARAARGAPCCRAFMCPCCAAWMNLARARLVASCRLPEPRGRNHKRHGGLEREGTGLSGNGPKWERA